MTTVGESDDLPTTTDARPTGNPALKYATNVIKIWGLFLVLIYPFSLIVSALSALPDLDLSLLSFLHHRSIITHSILIPWLLILALREHFKIVQALLLAAFGIHLSADVLSPPIGYGAVWLPPPSELSLGLLSQPWLAINAFAAFYLSLRRSPLTTQPALFWAILIAGLLYGIFNEENLLAVLAFVVLYMTAALSRFNGRLEYLPSHQLRTARDEFLESNFEQDRLREIKRAERAKLGVFRSAFLTSAEFLQSTARFLTVPIRHPIGSTIAVMVILLFYAVGRMSDDIGLEDGVISTTAKGVWKVHSAGGCILAEGGKYVAGTYTSDDSLCQ